MAAWTGWADQNTPFVLPKLELPCRVRLDQLLALGQKPTCAMQLAMSAKGQ